MSLDLPMAGIGSRFLAVTIDTLIQVGVGLLALLAVGVLGYMGALSGLAGSSIWIVAGFGIVVFLLMFGYFAIFEIVWNGQTPGKRIASIRVVKDSGRPLTPAETIGRNLLRIVDQLPAFYAIGVLVALLNSQNKRLGDFIAGSIVVREASLAELKPAWQTEGEASPRSAIPLGAGKLSMEDLALIDTFLHRRHSLTSDVRARMADQILNKLRPKLSFHDDGSSAAETILESLAYERRSSGAS